MTRLSRRTHLKNEVKQHDRGHVNPNTIEKKKSTQLKRVHSVSQCPSKPAAGENVHWLRKSGNLGSGQKKRTPGTFTILE